jgi:predicted PurR-regulated permease PerM
MAMSQATGERPPAPSERRVPRLSADSERAARRAFAGRVLRASLIVDAVLVATLLGGVIAWKLRAILLLIVIAIFITLLLHPLVSLFERRGAKRGLATGIVFVLGLLLVATLIFVIVQPLVGAAEHLANQLPKILRQAEHGRGAIGRFARRFHLLKYVNGKSSGSAQSLISKVSKPALSIGKGVISGVLSLVTVFFLTFFMLIHLPGIYRGILDWMQEERATRVRLIVSDVERSVVGYMAGDFATSLVAGLVITVTLLLTGVPYPVVLGVWVAVVDFLPLVGGLLAGVPTVIIAALHSLPAGIITLVVFLVYQEVENHVLYPIIMSRTVKLNSLWVLISVLIGASLGDIVGSLFGGFVGALLAVPAGSAVQVVVRDLWAHRRGSLLVTLKEPAVATATAGTEALDTGLLSTVETGGDDSSEPSAAAAGAGGHPERARDKERKRRRRRRPPPSRP